MTDQTAQSPKIILNTALSRLRSAIELLDRVGAPGHIAAHVDLAASELERVCGLVAEPKLPDELEMASLAE